MFIVVESVQDNGSSPVRRDAFHSSQMFFLNGGLEEQKAHMTNAFIQNHNRNENPKTLMTVTVVFKCPQNGL
jgi:hypothetical protein